MCTIVEHWRTCGNGMGLGHRVYVTQSMIQMCCAKLRFPACFTMLVGLAMAGTSRATTIILIQKFDQVPRDLQCAPDKWRPVLLGSHVIGAQECRLCILGDRMVQPTWAGCRYYWYQVRPCSLIPPLIELIIMLLIGALTS